GCLVKTAAGPALTVPGFPAAALDATGAGDAFAAGLLAALWRGWDLAAAARLANAVGAQCVTSLGATAGIGTWEETLAMLDAAG
ncbi:MAG: PfkB family carbohydrate kinase, partial [Anaerolineae bacterium]